MSEKWVTFLLDGEKFVTTLTTIQRSDVLVMLAERNTAEVVRIDRSGKNFHHVLQFLRDITYKVPVEVRGDLDYYIIPYIDDNLLYPDSRITDLENRLNKMERDSVLRPCKLCDTLISFTAYDECFKCSPQGWYIRHYVVEENKGSIQSSTIAKGDKLMTKDGTFEEVIEVFNYRSKSISGFNQNIIVSSKLDIEFCDSLFFIANNPDHTNFFGSLEMVNIRLKNKHNIRLSESEFHNPYKYYIAQTY